MDNASPVARLPVPGRPGPFDVSVQLVMTDRALLEGDGESALLEGYGPVPAAWARDLIAQTLEPPDASDASGRDGESARARVFVRRVLTDPVGSPVAVDSRARTAPAGLARLVRLRDGGTCRTPGCDAPIRHVDHVRAHAEGGRTSLDDLQGLCEACNYTKQVPGWTSRTSQPDTDQDTGPPGTPGPTPDTRHTVVITTPTGHTYTSVAPPLPGTITPAVPVTPTVPVTHPWRQATSPPGDDDLDQCDSPLETLLLVHLAAA